MTNLELLSEISGLLPSTIEASYKWVLQAMTAALKERVRELEEGLRDLADGVQGLPPLTAIAGVLTKQYEAARKLLNK